MDDTRNGTQPGVAAFPKETAAVVELSRGELRMRGRRRLKRNGAWRRSLGAEADIPNEAADSAAGTDLGFGRVLVA